jgi:hypothetical protein
VACRTLAALKLRTLKTSVLRKIYNPERDEKKRNLEKITSEELHDLYYSLNVIRVIKSRRMTWTGHMARIEETNVCRVLVGKPENKTTWKT